MTQDLWFACSLAVERFHHHHRATGDRVRCGAVVLPAAALASRGTPAIWRFAWWSLLLRLKMGRREREWN